MLQTFRFTLQFNSLAEFAAFVAIVRGEDLDDARVQQLTAKLVTSTKALQAAENAAATPTKPKPQGD